MFGMGGVEMLVIGIVALIVVGPKDLPVLFRNVGQFVGRARGMARDFQSAMNTAARESGVNDLNKTIQSATNPLGSAMESVKEAASDATKGLNMDLDSLDDERADMAQKIQKSTARAAQERQTQEAAETTPAKSDP